jgi:type VI protein secretion system component Hcp
MTKFENSFARHFPLAVVFLGLVTAASSPAAQAQEIVYLVSTRNVPPGGEEVWPKSSRPDGKLTALSFTFGAQNVAQIGAQSSGAGAGRATMQDSVLTIAVGEPVPLWLRHAVIGAPIDSLLIEFPIAAQKAQSRAPFAVRFTQAFVSSVQVVKRGGEAGLGVAEVRFKAARVEVFTATQDATTGAVRAGPQLNWDFVKNVTFIN